MKVLVIPDVHLKPWIFDEVEQLDKSLYDNIVCVGDLVDDWNQQANMSLYEETLRRILEFDKAHPAMLWCWGNHDLSYRFSLRESGFSYMMIPTVNRYLEKLLTQCEEKGRFKAIHRIDDTLFSHAGLTVEYVNYLYKNIPNDIDQILKKIETKLFSRSTIYDIWIDFSPLWTRPQTGLIPMYKENEYFQVVGHTPVKEPLLVRSVLTLDTYSTYSDGSSIGDNSLVVVDTKTHEWTRVN